MGQRRMGMLAVRGLAAAFVVAGCGGGEGGGSPTATIVSDLPLQGSSRGQQETVVNAITLALEERDYMAGDVQIEYISQDDATAQAGKWDEARCADNAQSAAQDEETAGPTPQARPESGARPDVPKTPKVRPKMRRSSAGSGLTTLVAPRYRSRSSTRPGSEWSAMGIPLS